MVVECWRGGRPVGGTSTWVLLEAARPEAVRAILVGGEGVAGTSLAATSFFRFVGMVSSVGAFYWLLNVQWRSALMSMEEQ